MTTLLKVIKVIEDTISSSVGVSINKDTALRTDLKMSDHDIDLLASNIEQFYFLTRYLHLSGMSKWKTVGDIVTEIEDNT